MTHINTNFSDLRHLLDHKTMENVQMLQPLNNIHHCIRNFKILLKERLNFYCERGLYTAKANLLDHLIQHLYCLGCQEQLHNLVYERFNDYIKRAYRSVSQYRTCLLEAILSAVDIKTRNRRQELHKSRLTMKSTVSEKLGLVSMAGPFLVRGGPKTTINCIEQGWEQSISREALESWRQTCCRDWILISRGSVPVF